MNFLQQIIPDNTAETIATVIIMVLSWWLGRKNGTKERRKYPSRRY